MAAGAIIGGMRFFNTAGPVREDRHYRIPPLSRLDLESVLDLLRQEKYFALHAPRQSGKTTTLLALRDLLNEGAAGEVQCVYANLEVGQAGREDTGRAMRAIVSELGRRALLLGDGFPQEAGFGILEREGPDTGPLMLLTRWQLENPKPLVLLLDEVDALVGDTLVSFLRQLRVGYDERPEAFPRSVVLCGLRQVRDYRTRLGDGKEVVAGGSPFNIRDESLRLGDFDRRETDALLAQHTADTGQEFRPEALTTVWEQTRGQPWLVNALAYQACFRAKAGLDRSRAITADDLLEAREALILRRDTHLDQLGDKLREERVRRVIEPLLSGGEGRASERDFEYARDLGLVAADAPTRIANPIYREVIPRELTWIVQQELDLDAVWYVDAEGGLDVPKLLTRFQEFFREHSEHWMGRFRYSEAGAQLLLQAYCQRVVNGGGRVDREYGLGRRRTDLLLSWPRGDAWSRFVIECKVLHGSREATERRGLEQTAAYLDLCGAEAGHLVIFDRSEERSWEEKIYRREAPTGGPPITIWGA